MSTVQPGWNALCFLSRHPHIAILRWDSRVLDRSIELRVEVNGGQVMAAIRGVLPLLLSLGVMTSCGPVRPISPPPSDFCDWDDCCDDEGCWEEEEEEYDCEFWGDCEEEYTPVEMIPTSPWMGLCLDGVHQMAEGFADCEDYLCLELEGCCIDVGRTWIQGDFGMCESVETCGWTDPHGDDSITIEQPWVTFKADVNGEVGLWSEPVIELLGETTVSFVAHLSPEGCTQGSCAQSLGAVLTGQTEPTTSVTPTVGLYLDGNGNGVHCVIGDRVEHTISLTPEEIASPMGFAIQRRTDGSVAFWSGLEVTDLESSPSAVIAGLPSYETDLFVLSDLERQRLVLVGNLSGDGEARFGGVTLDQRVCDIPGAFDERGSAPVMAPVPEMRRVGRPTVWRDSDVENGLFMIHEEDEHLAISSSTDGRTWERINSLSFDTSPSGYGTVARRAPTVVQTWSGSEPQLHLYYEAESEYQGLDAGDQPTFAIAHAVSNDGVNWIEPQGGASIALMGDDEHRWRREVGQPSVVAMADGSLMMFFVGHDTEMNATHLFYATSVDGVNWMVEEMSLRFIDSSTSVYERDGVGYPSVLRRGAELHLWYTGFANGRESIIYAVGSLDDGNRWAFRHIGQVLDARATWESDRVLAPAPILLEPDIEDARPAVALLHLFYAAGPVGREQLGLVTRELPARFVQR